ncbi:hypothetical protein C0J52_00738 [Blattella germanica]|nr:hypothetical protein C0J52_00738 [Blattella germanica]
MDSISYGNGNLGYEIDVALLRNGSGNIECLDKQGMEDEMQFDIERLSKENKYSENNCFDNNEDSSSKTYNFRPRIVKKEYVFNKSTLYSLCSGFESDHGFHKANKKPNISSRSNRCNSNKEMSLFMGNYSTSEIFKENKHKLKESKTNNKMTVKTYPGSSYNLRPRITSKKVGVGNAKPLNPKIKRRSWTLKRETKQSSSGIKENSDFWNDFSEHLEMRRKLRSWTPVSESESSVAQSECCYDLRPRPNRNNGSGQQIIELKMLRMSLGEENDSGFSKRYETRSQRKMAEAACLQGMMALSASETFLRRSRNDNVYTKIPGVSKSKKFPGKVKTKTYLSDESMSPNSDSLHETTACGMHKFGKSLKDTDSSVTVCSNSSDGDTLELNREIVNISKNALKCGVKGGRGLTPSHGGSRLRSMGNNFPSSVDAVSQTLNAVHFGDHEWNPIENVEVANLPTQSCRLDSKKSIEFSPVEATSNLGSQRTRKQPNRLCKTNASVHQINSLPSEKSSRHIRLSKRLAELRIALQNSDIPLAAVASGKQESAVDDDDKSGGEDTSLFNSSFESTTFHSENESPDEERGNLLVKSASETRETELQQERKHHDESNANDLSLYKKDDNMELAQLVMGNGAKQGLPHFPCSYVDEHLNMLMAGLSIINESSEEDCVREKNDGFVFSREHVKLAQNAQDISDSENSNTEDKEIDNDNVSGTLSVCSLVNELLNLTETTENPNIDASFSEDISNTIEVDKSSEITEFDGNEESSDVRASDLTEDDFDVNSANTVSVQVDQSKDLGLTSSQACATERGNAKIADVDLDVNGSNTVDVTKANAKEIVIPFTVHEEDLNDKALITVCACFAGTTLEEENARPSPINGLVLTAKTTSGHKVEIKVDQDRPKAFKSSKARHMWDQAVYRNALKLKDQIESGDFIPGDLKKEFDRKVNMKNDERNLARSHRIMDKKKNKLKWLKLESRLVELDALVKSNLSLTKADPDRCLAHLDEISMLSIDPLMLKKHPQVVETIKKLKRYVGNVPEWNLDEEQKVSDNFKIATLTQRRDGFPSLAMERETIFISCIFQARFLSKANQIRDKADHIFNKFKAMFTVPEGRSFWQVFADHVILFKQQTSHMSEDLVYSLTVDPSVSKATAESGSSEEEQTESQKTQEEEEEQQQQKESEGEEENRAPELKKLAVSSYSFCISKDDARRR